MSCVFSVALSANVLLLSPAFGRQEEPKKPEAKSGDAVPGVPSPSQAEKPKESVEPDKPEAKSKDLLSATGHDGMVNRRIAGLLRLHAAINDKLKLSEEKRKSIDQMFDDYMAALLGPDPGPHITPSPEDVTPPQEIPRLNKELSAAQESGDKEAVASIQAKINAAKMVLEPSVIDPPELFVIAISAELGKEREEDFNKIVERWQIIRVKEIVPDNEFMRLMRSIRDPELGLPDAERRELVEMLSKSMRKMSFNDRKDPAKVSELKATMLPKVFEKLKPEQRERAEKIMAMLEQWNKEDEKAVASVRARLGGQSTNKAPLSSRLKKVDPPPPSP
jgi:hypothetical protein